ncbi:MAG: hypothetical protein H0T51_15070 [Pirellulales bacterium]|nr:hypothetical protein [Pirellulales bacterium]
MELLVLFTEVAGRDCNECQLYVFDEKLGQIVRQPSSGQPIRRSPRHKAPCRTDGESCPKGTPETSNDFTAQNWQAYFHFLGCEATGRFPDESRVNRNARLIALARERAERKRQWLAQKRLEMTAEHLAEMMGLSVQARLS